jgi:hypothetical protein
MKLVPSLPPRARTLVSLSVIATIAIYNTVALLMQFSQSKLGAWFGMDTFSHLNTVAYFVESRALPSFSSSPNLLQWIVAQFTLAGADPNLAFSLVAIASIPLAIVATSTLAWQLGGRRVAMFTAVFFGLIGKQPLQNLYDGTVPSIYGTAVFIPLLITGLLLTHTLPKLWQKLTSGALAVACFFVLVLTHHLSSAVFIATILITALIYGVWLLFSAQTRRQGIICITALLLLIPFWNFVIPQSVQSLVGSLLVFTHSFPWFSLVTDGVEKPGWTPILYAINLSGLLFQLGVIGIVAAVITAYRHRNHAKAIVYLGIAIWAALYFGGSLWSGSGEPTRLARDFAVPGSILAALCVTSIISLHQQRIQYAWAALVLVLTVSGTLSIAARHSYLSSTPVHFLTQEQADVIQSYRTEIDEGVLYAPVVVWEGYARAVGINTAWANSPSLAREFTNTRQAPCIISVGFSRADGLFNDPAFFSIPEDLLRSYSRRETRVVQDQTVTRWCRDTEN